MRSATRRTMHRLTRPGLALALVLAQAMAAFGYPIVRPKAGGPCGEACGCISAHGADGCCCVSVPLTPPPPLPTTPADCGKCGREADACCCSEPLEPEPPACPKCRVQEKSPSVTLPVTLNESTPLVRWVPAWQASKCRGESPQGLMAEIPAVPPVVPSQSITLLTLAGIVTLADFLFASVALASLDPPPRCG